MAVGFFVQHLLFGGIPVKVVPFFAIFGGIPFDKDGLFLKLQKLRPHYKFPTEKWGTTTLCESTSPFVRDLTKLIDSGIPRAHATPRSMLKLCWSRLDTIIAENLLTAFRNGNAVIMRGFGAMALVRAMMKSTSEDERKKLIRLHEEIVKSTVLQAGAWPPVYFYLWRDLTISHPDLDLDGPELEYVAKMNHFFRRYKALQGQTVIFIDMGRPFEEVLAEVLEHIRRIERELEFTVA